MKIHTILRLSTPSKSAGPKLLAGFTDVPVNQSPRRWTSTKDNPITNPAILLYSFFDVTPSTENTNTNVRIISTITPSQIFPFTPSRPLLHSIVKSRHRNIHRKNAQSIPQRNCATRYRRKSFVFIHPVIHTPRLTAGLT